MRKIRVRTWGLQRRGGCNSNTTANVQDNNGTIGIAGFVKYFLVLLFVIRFLHVVFSTTYGYTGKTLSSSLFLFPTNATATTILIDADTANEILDEEVIPVFYNLFVATPGDLHRVQTLAEEQLSYRLPQHRLGPVYVTSIGVRLELPNTTLIAHHESGNEVFTLRSLWRYCKDHPNERVTYLHSKGSFHPSPENERLRSFMTRGALRDCASPSVRSSGCNVCSTRFSPLPHPHSPGNFWTAECSYISGLMDPSRFEATMQESPLASHKEPGVEAFPPRIGTERFSAEHWVHSHPSVQPCDLYDVPSFLWGYAGIPQEPDRVPFSVKPAPRFPLETFVRGECHGVGTLCHRIEEYKFLYAIYPNASWWGWDLFPQSDEHGCSTSNDHGVI